LIDPPSQEIDLMKTLAAICLLLSTLAFAETPKTATVLPKITPGSSVYIEPMDGFETYLAAAILKKKVPVLVVGLVVTAIYHLLPTIHFFLNYGWASALPPHVRSLSLQHTQQPESLTLSLSDVLRLPVAFDQNQTSDKESSARKGSRLLRRMSIICLFDISRKRRVIIQISKPLCNPCRSLVSILFPTQERTN
jgi:hypothetical protein